MKNAKIKVVCFNDSDVIATSGKTVSLCNLGNGKYGDASIYFPNGDGKLNPRGVEETVAEINALGKNAFGVNDIFNAVFEASDSVSDTLGNIFGQDATRNIFHSPTDYDAANSAFNGTYTWNGTKFIKQTN